MTEAETIDLTFDSGTAYDLFVSLVVLHDPEKYGLRGSWAAGVRSRLPGPEREFLQGTLGLLMPFEWIYELPSPKDGATVLEMLAALPPEERLPSLQKAQLRDEPEMLSLLQGVSERGRWTDDELREFAALLTKENRSQQNSASIRRMANAELDMWSDLEAAGEMLLSALTAYYDQFYAEEEKRIRKTLEVARQDAEVQARNMSLSELLEELSQGVRLAKRLDMARLVLVPSFWATPLMIFAQAGPDRELYLFGARPANMSLVPGDVVPDALYQALKALADPTRLKILRYLTEEPSTPAELARRLRLRAPTVIHHLDSLRLARLVQLTLSHEGKRYAIRAEAVDRTFELLNDFLGDTEEDLATEDVPV